MILGHKSGVVSQEKLNNESRKTNKNKGHAKKDESNRRTMEKTRKLRIRRN